MYGNEIIDAINKYKGMRNKCVVPDKLANKFIGALKDSTYFYFGEQKDIEAFCDDNSFTPFIGKYEITEIPFDNMAICFNDPDGPDYLLLLQEKESSKDEPDAFISQFFYKIKGDIWRADQMAMLHAYKTANFLVGFLSSMGYMFHHPDDPEVMNERISPGHIYRQTKIINIVLAVLTTKNISIIENKPSKRENTSVVKKGKHPIFSHYTLKINPLKKKKVSEKNDHQGKSNRFHICRGHFRYYTKEKPLFGRYSGRVWVPSHSRGDEEEGIIHKDYKVVTGS